MGSSVKAREGPADVVAPPGSWVAGFRGRVGEAHGGVWGVVNGGVIPLPALPYAQQLKPNSDNRTRGG